MTATFLTLHPGGTADLQQPHLILVGLPGSGKSSIGPQVAEALERPYLDFDAEIERRDGRAILEIFAASGEEYFRKCERTLTEEVGESGGMVLSPGGGWAADPNSVRRLRPPARMVYLRVSPGVALARMAERAGDRPLLRRPDPLAELQRLYEQRDKHYMKADLHVDTELLDPQEVTELIVDYFRVLVQA